MNVKRECECEELCESVLLILEWRTPLKNGLVSGLGSRYQL